MGGECDLTYYDVCTRMLTNADVCRRRTDVGQNSQAVSLESKNWEYLVWTSEGDQT